MPKPVKLRIRYFYYNTTIKGTTNTAGLREHADNLIRKLYNDREDDFAATIRSIIFIGHSLGGMLIKRVSRIMPIIPSFWNKTTPCSQKSPYTANSSRQRPGGHECTYRSLWQASRGIVSWSVHGVESGSRRIDTHQMFFSTAHFGLANTNDVWANFAKHVLRLNPPVHLTQVLRLHKTC